MSVSKVERFEDLIAWQKAREMTKQVYAATRDGAFRHDLALARQMQRAAVSVVSNIAEGFERTNRGEFAHFLLIAKGSCAELRAQLYLALDIGYLDEELFAQLKDLAEEVGRIVGGLRAAVELQRPRQGNAKPHNSYLKPRDS